MRIWIIALAAALLVLPGCCCESDYCYDCYGYVYGCSTVDDEYSDAYYDSLAEDPAEPGALDGIW